MSPGRGSFLPRIVRHKGYLAASVSLIGLAVALFIVVAVVIDAMVLGRYRSLGQAGVYRVVSDTPSGNLSFPDLVDLQALNDHFTIVGGSEFPLLNVAVAGQLNLERAVMVTHNYFRALNLPLLAGPGWPELPDETHGTRRGLIVSERFVQRRLQRSPEESIGLVVTVNGAAFPIVGVTTWHYQGLETRPADVWLTLADGGRLANEWTLTSASRGMAWIEPWAAVKPGSVAQAAALLRLRAAEIEREHPVVRAGARLELRHPLRAAWHLERTILIWGFIAGLVALTLWGIAVLNAGILAALYILRRLTEFQIRLSLGASGRQLREELTGIWIVLGVAASGLAVLLAIAILQVLKNSSIDPMVVPLLRYARPWPILPLGAVTLGSLGAAVAAAVQLWTLARTDASELIHAQRSSPRRARLASWLLLCQGTLAVALTVIAGVHVQSAQAALAVEPGFERSGLVIASLDLRDLGYERDEALAFWEGVWREAHHHPTLAAVGVSNRLPLVGLNTTRPAINGQESRAAVGFIVISPGYFAALGLGLLEGRDIRFTDTIASRPVVVVNETFARQHWPERSPLGELLVPFPGAPAAEVVGVVQDVRPDFLHARQPILYIPLTTSYTHRSYLYLRVNASSAEARQVAAAFLQQLAPTLPPRSLVTFDEYLEQTTLDLQVGAGGLLLLAYLSIGLIFAGTYAVSAYIAAQRRQEFAIRMALGATRARLLWDECRSRARSWGTSILLGGLLGVWIVSLGEGFLLLTPAFDYAVIFMAAGALVVVSTASVALALWMHGPKELAESLRVV
jgi:predicted permease